MLTDSGVVYTDVIITQSEASNKTGRWQLHLCCYTDEVRRVNARLATLLSTITVANFTQRLCTQ